MLLSEVVVWWNPKYPTGDEALTEEDRRLQGAVCVAPRPSRWHFVETGEAEAECERYSERAALPPVAEGEEDYASRETDWLAELFTRLVAGEGLDASVVAREFRKIDEFEAEWPLRPNLPEVKFRTARKKSA